MNLPTTVIGSYPYARMTAEEAIIRAVDEQISAGIDLISDGQVRADMVALFVRGIPGFDLQGRKYNIVSGIKKPDKPICLADLTLAQKQAGGRARLKGIITGPTTIAHCCVLGQGAPYKPGQTLPDASVMRIDEELVMDIAGALATEAMFLADAGFQTLQIDEPFFSLPGVDLELGMRAISLITENTGFSTLHVCGDTAPVLARLLESAPVDMLAVEGGRIESVDWLTREFVESRAKKICWGVVATDTNRVEETSELETRIRAGVEKIGAQNIWISPDCGMRARKPSSARMKLERMIQAVRHVSATLY